MASNSFGDIFRITTWGESHGRAIGVTIDGCPAGLSIDETEINHALEQRKPGKNSLTSPRKEQDRAQILSGVFFGKTTGAPLCIYIENTDSDSSHYEAIKDLLRPGHANFSYLEKFGSFDYRGGGRASARETACRVAAGAVATKLLQHYNISLCAFIKQIGNIACDTPNLTCDAIEELSACDPLFCPDKLASRQMVKLIEATQEQGDSLGGIVAFKAENLPCGLGDPLYDKLEAKLAYAMLSIPASKGFEIGSGFECVTKKGSEHNDLFTSDHEDVKTKTNYAGGILAGISTGMPVYGKVAFKPTSSIKKAQETVDLLKNKSTFKLPEGSRHDPCVAIRAVAVVKAMLALVLVDALLKNRSAKL